MHSWGLGGRENLPRFLYHSLLTFSFNFLILIFDMPFGFQEHRIVDFRHYIFFRRVCTPPPHVSIPWLKHKCSVFRRTDAIFNLNCRKSAAFRNGQEAQNHGGWYCANTKASLAFSQWTVLRCCSKESKNTAYKDVINKLTNFQAFISYSFVPAILILAYFQLY